MKAFVSLLRENHNYRYTWIGQLVSEVGDHFNNIAVFSLAVKTTHSPLVVTFILLARAVAVMAAGPLAGVLLDRLNRQRVMITSDLVRMLVAAAFILTVKHPNEWLLYGLSFALMFASPFFTSGRASILPTIATEEELHTANSLTQTTGWTTLSIGAFLGGTMAGFGYELAFAINALSFLASALCIAQLRVSGGFRVRRKALTEAEIARPWHEYIEGLRYIRSIPLVFGLLMVGVGWASGGGAAQILFTVFGEMVFNKGPMGLGAIWGCAGVGLVIGGAIAYRFGRQLSFETYKWTIVVCYIIHGGSYILFSQMKSFALTLVFITLSRAGVGVSSVLNMWQLLRTVPDEFRGRVFSTNESVQWSVMMLSMCAAGAATEFWNARTIGAIAGALSSMTAIYWAWANVTGRLPEPARPGIDPEEIEVHGEPAA
ncbi:MAG TPA: MFS transporter [Bryobacteraceae bacterium]|nr:MFS transporter [Bryobacteraceae bacterium]